MLAAHECTWTSRGRHGVLRQKLSCSAGSRLPQIKEEDSSPHSASQRRHPSKPAPSSSSQRTNGSNTAGIRSSTTTLLPGEVGPWRWPSVSKGSLFNHDEHPNVSYTIQPESDTIIYTTTRTVEEGEELCIYYGSKLWFQPAGTAVGSSAASDIDDGWGGLAGVEPTSSPPSILDGDPNEIIPEEKLPFERYKPPPEEETAETIRTALAWVVDIPDARNIGPMLTWLRRSGLDPDELPHLKRVRKSSTTSTFLLTLASEPPILPEYISLPDPPRQVLVPTSTALTATSLALKNALWPTTFSPRRKGEVEDWTREKTRWAWEAMKVAVDAAQKAKDAGELPIAAYIPSDPPFLAHDTRQSTCHPLRHAVQNAIRQLADHQAANPTVDAGSERQNGQNYLLTSLTLFTTHEPCIMCSMALLHSRVKEIFFLIPMDKTGGCGGATCLPSLPGVNHRFGICRWSPETLDIAELHVDDVLDA